MGVRTIEEIEATLPEAVALERENVRAFLERDIGRLETLWSDALVVNSPMNTVNDKRTVLELLARGVIAHDCYDVDIEVIRDFGEVVVVMGADHVTFTPDGPVVHRRFTDAWRREGGAWKLFARQATVVAPAQAGTRPASC